MGTRLGVTEEVSQDWASPPASTLETLWQALFLPGALVSPSGEWVGDIPAPQAYEER